MSRFWAAGGASSGSDSDSDSDSSSGYSSEASGGGGGGGGGGDNKWAALSDEESSSEEEQRVVKSGKERAIETFNNHITNLRKAMKARDYYKIQTEFDDLAKAMIKYKSVLKAGVPRPLVRILCDLEDYVPQRLADKAAFKKLSARQGRALNRMKLTLKKHNKAYQVVMKAYRANPVVSSDEEDDDEEDEAEEEDSSDEDSDSEKVAAKKKKADSDSDEDSDEDSDDKDSDDDDDDDDDDDSDAWGSDSESSSSSDDEGGAYSQLKGRARWLKKNTVTKVKVVKNKEVRSKLRQEQKAAAALAATKASDAITATKSIIPEEQVTPAILHKKVQEIASQRGRRGKDNRQLLRQLEALYRLSLGFGPRIEVPILMYVISAQYGLLRTMDDCMDMPTWKSCANYLSRIADVLLQEGYTLVPETMEESDYVTAGMGKKAKAAAKINDIDGAMAAVAAEEQLVNPHTKDFETEDERAERLRQEREAGLSEEEKKQIPVIGSLALHMQRLEEEYVKSLQQLSHHSEEYVARLRDESKLVVLLTKFQEYFQRQDMLPEAASLAQLRIEHLYYRHDSIAKHVDKASEFFERFGEASMLHPGCITNEDAAGKGKTDFAITHPSAVSGKPTVEGGDSTAESTDFTKLMADLCTFVYKHGTDDQAKNNAIICHVYHHSIHDRFLEARDLLLMSHVQENIYNSENVTTMIMFNRMMVNLGMCAFRSGRIYDAHQCLGEVCSGRVRELLAQGVSSSRFNDKSADQEKAEKRRQVPYHQHINMDLLEACHLISAMLLEVPNMAANMVDGDAQNDRRRQRIISRTFRKFNDQYNHQVFTGPPEQTRDFVMKAASALMKGDWKTCADLVTNLEVWGLLPGESHTVQEQLREMLTAKIKLEGLRTYLFSFSSQYDSLSLTQLCAMFEMSKNEVHSVVSKMMINRELYASWDQPTETIVLRKVEPTSLQAMALQFAEKTSTLVEANERLLDSQSGSYGYRDGDDRFHRGGGDGGRGGDRFNNRGGGRGRGGGYRGGGGRGRGRGGNAGGRGRGGGGYRGGGGRGRGRGGGGGGGGYRGGGRGGDRRY